MGSAATMTIIKMLETVPEQLQDRVVEHVREYIEDLRDEARWNESFSRTQETLVTAARLARKEIAEGKRTQAEKCDALPDVDKIAIETGIYDPVGRRD